MCAFELHSIGSRCVAGNKKRGAKCCALVSELVGAPDIAARVRAVRAAMHKES